MKYDKTIDSFLKTTLNNSSFRKIYKGQRKPSEGNNLSFVNPEFKGVVKGQIIGVKVKKHAYLFSITKVVSDKKVKIKPLGWCSLALGVELGAIAGNIPPKRRFTVQETQD